MKSIFNKYIDNGLTGEIFYKDLSEKEIKKRLIKRLNKLSMKYFKYKLYIEDCNFDYNATKSRTKRKSIKKEINIYSIRKN